MAFIPDDAVDHAFELSPTAFKLYCLICRRRDHRTGNAYIRPSYAKQVLDVSRSQIYRAIDELKDRKWIAANGPTMVPLMGSFAPVDRPKPAPIATPLESSQPCDEKSQQCDEKSHQRDTVHIGLNQPSLSSARNPSQPIDSSLGIQIDYWTGQMAKRHPSIPIDVLEIVTTHTLYNRRSQPEPIRHVKYFDEQLSYELPGLLALSDQAREAMRRSHRERVIKWQTTTSSNSTNGNTVPSSIWPPTTKPSGSGT